MSTKGNMCMGNENVVGSKPCVVLEIGGAVVVDGGTGNENAP